MTPELDSEISIRLIVLLSTEHNVTDSAIQTAINKSECPSAAQFAVLNKMKYLIERAGQIVDECTSENSSATSLKN